MKKPTLRAFFTWCKKNNVPINPKTSPEKRMERYRMYLETLKT